MKKLDVKQNTDEWLEARKGKITGSKLKDIMPNSRGGNYAGWYEYLAERLEKPTGEEIDGEDARNRGHRLETEAVELFCARNDIDVSEVINDGFYVSEANESLGNSPDGVYNDGKSEIEVKCLYTKNHLQIYLEDYPGDLPKDFKYQMYHSFIVNDELKEKHLVFYCPQLPDIALFAFTVKREDIKDELEETINNLYARLAEADTIVENITKNNSF